MTLGHRSIRQTPQSKLHLKTGPALRSRTLQTNTIERDSLENKILQTLQNEQRDLGEQLHDGLCQELAAILMFTNSLIKKVERNNDFDIAELKKISVLLSDAASKVRNTARGLYPEDTEGTSLMQKLGGLVLETRMLSSVSCRFHYPELIRINDNHITSHLYKIAQEGISNAIKHGKAQSIEVGLTRKDDMLTLTVKDDGVGFAGDPQDSKGIGLKIMKHRAHVINASLQVESNVPHGVILICSLKGLP